MKIKKAAALALACLLLFCAGLSAYAEEAPAEDGGNRYDGYEDDWLDNDFEAIEEKPSRSAEEKVPTPQPWYGRVSVVPVVIGVLAGAIAVYVFYRNSRPEPLSPAPYVLSAETSVDARQDRLAEETHTKRNLSG